MVVVVVVAIKADQGPIARGRCRRRWTERGGGSDGGGGAWIGAAGDDHLSPLRASVTGNAGRGVVVVVVVVCACGGGGYTPLAARDSSSPCATVTSYNDITVTSPLHPLIKSSGREEEEEERRRRVAGPPRQRPL